MKNLILLISVCISSIVIGQNNIIKGKLTEGFTYDIKLVKKSFFNGKLICLAPEKIHIDDSGSDLGFSIRITFDQQGFHLEKYDPLIMFNNHKMPSNWSDTTLVKLQDLRTLLDKDSTLIVHKDEFMMIDGYFTNIYETTGQAHYKPYYMCQNSRTRISILINKRCVYRITLSSVPENREKVKELVQKIIDSIEIQN